MQTKAIHIVSFDNPYPPNYGGVIDVFFKIKALHQLGFKIHLHCFVAETPNEHKALEAISESVYFYKTSTNYLQLFSKIPFSIISRNSKKLVENILKVDAPILYEGLKTSYLVNDVRLKNYFKILRLHNIEQDYFLGISKNEKNPIFKFLFYLESKKYLNTENVIQSFNRVACLSIFENNYIQNKFKSASYIPVFHGNETVLPLSDYGKYVLYHGDLNSPDNQEVVRFLTQVFKKIPNRHLKIASSSKEKWTLNLIGKSENISFVKLLDYNHLLDLFEDAHVNISWSFQKSGTKLKLINSLFNSRFSIINENIIDDAIISDLCVIANNESELLSKIEDCFNKPYSDYQKRKEILEVYLNDVSNAQLIANLLP